MDTRSAVTISGLWSDKDKQGNLILKGKLNPTTAIYVFTNTNKTSPNSPDYLLKFARIEKQEPKEDVPF